MNEPVLCIDFGSAYTKVAIRRDPNEASELIRSDSLLDDLRICVPSLVLLDQRGKQPLWECGTKAVDRVAGPGIQIFRNFKPRLFRDAPTPEPASEIERFLDSPEVRGLARARGLDTDLLGVLGLLRGRARAPQAESSSVLVADQDPVDEAAKEFFRALLGTVEQAATRLGLENVRSLSARLCVPKLSEANGGDQTPAERRVVALLSEAGWCVDPERPTITEPFSNAIGTLTGGRNQLWQPGQGRGSDYVAHFGHMFAFGPLIEAFRRGTGEHTALVIDIGAFTTDFAALRFDACGDIEDPPEIFEHSEPLGIDLLDQRFRQALPSPQATAFAGLPLSRREQCKQQVYSENKEFPATPIIRIGSAAQRPKIQAELNWFADQAGKAAEHFIEQHGLQEIHELILTGGGNSIPTVRDTLLERVMGRCRVRPIVFLPGKVGQGNGKLRLIDQKLLRGASALGGTSLFFDNSFR